MNKTVLNYVCLDCGFIFILPRPSKESMCGLYTDGKFSEKFRGNKLPTEANSEEIEIVENSVK